MRLERLTYNKIKIFLTTDDLSDRGLTKEDIWKDSLKWNELFHEMLEEAHEEFGVSFHGSVAVEIFSVYTQGMIMIVTVDEQEDEQFSEPFLEMRVSVKTGEEILFDFTQFEDIIQLAKQLNLIGVKNGSVYFLNELYYFYLKDVPPNEMDKITSILSEYGSTSFLGFHYLEEYGNKIIEDTAVKTIIHYFN